MSLDLISKAISKGEGAQTDLYTQQPRNLSNLGLQTNYKQLSIPTLTPSVGLSLILTLQSLTRL